MKTDTANRTEARMYTAPMKLKVRTCERINAIRKEAAGNPMTECPTCGSVGFHRTCVDAFHLGQHVPISNGHTHFYSNASHELRRNELRRLES